MIESAGEFEFHPFSVGVTTDGLPVRAGWPFPRGVWISPNCVDVCVFGLRTRIQRSQIDVLERRTGFIRIRWTEGSVIINSLTGMQAICDAFEAAGYQFDTEP